MREAFDESRNQKMDANKVYCGRLSRHYTDGRAFADAAHSESVGKKPCPFGRAVHGDNFYLCDGAGTSRCLYDVDTVWPDSHFAADSDRRYRFYDVGCRCAHFDEEKNRFVSKADNAVNRSGRLR